MINFKVDNLIYMNAALQDFINYLKEHNASDDEVFDSRLVSCELITNVIRHLGESAFFSGDLSGEAIQIRVWSQNSGGIAVKPTLPDVFAESGRGLYIVNTICDGNIEVVDNEIVVCIKRKRQR